MQNEKATKAAIRATLNELAKVAKAGDLVVYFQSSHGGPTAGTTNPKDVFLVAFDGNYYDGEMAEDLAKFQSGVKIVVILDACFSGGMFQSIRKETPNAEIKGFSQNPMARFAQNVMEQIGKSPNQNIANDTILRQVVVTGPEIGWLTASNFSETSVETGAWFPDGTATGGGTGASGLFTQYLIRGFSNADQNLDGNVSFKELFNYASYGVDYWCSIRRFFLPQFTTTTFQTPKMFNETLLQQLIVSKTSSRDNFEPDDTPKEAAIITIGSESSIHSLDPFGDEDWFRFSVVSSSQIVIEPIGEGEGAAILELFDFKYPPLRNLIGKPLYCSLPPGDYYLRVSNCRFYEDSPPPIIPAYKIRVSTY